MILLASASEVRARLLRAAGAQLQITAAGVDEAAAKARLLVSGASPHDIAVHLAEAKALAVTADPDVLVIGADQTLDLDGELLDKAENLAVARDRLRRLRGRAHRLHTAAALVRNRKPIWRLVVSPFLTMRPFSDAYLETYLAKCGEAALASVGCYHLEGLGAQLFERIEGDYFAVLGLPLIELLAALREFGALEL